MKQSNTYDNLEMCSTCKWILTCKSMKRDYSHIFNPCPDYDSTDDNKVWRINDETKSSCN